MFLVQAILRVSKIMEKSKRKQASRIQTSILSSAEKKVLVAIAERLPKRVASDMLTAVGVFGSAVMALGYYLSNFNVAWLWLASFGLVLNWFGDSLDGTVARVRNTQRPVYGYYIDHTVDVLNEAMMFIGAGLSPFLDLRAAVIAYIIYLALTLNVYINVHLRGEFNLSYMGMGPTEFRVVLILLNTILFFIGPSVIGNTVLIYISFAIPAILLIIYIVTIIKDIRHFAKTDPPVKNENSD